MTTLDQLGEQLNAMLAEVIASIQAREAALAHAIELSSESGSVRAAFNQGMQHRQTEILALIDEQLIQLQLANLSPLPLQTLKRRILHDS